MAHSCISRAVGTVLPLRTSVKQFILEHGQGGVYTTARCTADNRVFELESHVSRITEGLKEVFPKQCAAASSELRERVLAQMRTVADEFSLASRITVVGHPPAETGEDFPISVLGEPLPSAPMNGVPVVVRLCSRTNPTVKDSSFVLEREKFEGTKGACNEFLLGEKNEDGRIAILEGGSSNFFALYEDNSKENSESQRYILRTAGEDQVLSGTVRKLVLEVAQQQNEFHIEVDETHAPLLQDIEQWACCFVTSTSRLVLPIESVVVPTGLEEEAGFPLLIEDVHSSSATQDVYKFDLSQAPAIEALQTGVENAILDRSTKLQ